MTEWTLLNFYQNVYKHQIDYCVVCLRTSHDRRMEEPNYVKRFQHSLNLPFMLHGTNQKACNICERQAAAAIRYFSAAKYASYAISVMDELKMSTRKYNMLSQCVTHLKKNAWLTSVLSCESEILQHRSRSQLLMTEVLVVSASNNTLMEGSRSENSSDIYVIPDDEPLPERVGDTLKISAVEQSIVIYDDDDDDPLLVKTELPSNDSKARNDSKKVTLPSIDTIAKNVSLDHPKYHKNPTLVPIHKLLDNPALGDLSILDKDTVIETCSTTPTNYMLHPIMFDNGIVTVPSLSANIVNGKLVMFDPDENVVKTPRIAVQNGANIDFISEPYRVDDVLKNLSEQHAAKPDENVLNAPETELQNVVKIDLVPDIDRVDNVSKASSHQSASDVQVYVFTTNKQNTQGSQNAKTYDEVKPVLNFDKNDAIVGGRNPHKNRSLGEPVDPHRNPSLGDPLRQRGPEMREDRINWEDKIPMDVISIVDENDTIMKKPRYSNYPQPLGITNITSLDTDEL